MSVSSIKKVAVITLAFGVITACQQDECVAPDFDIKDGLRMLDDVLGVDARPDDDVFSVVADVGAVGDAGPDTSVDAVAPDATVPPVCPWRDASDGLVGGAIQTVAFDPRVSGRIYASSGGALVRSVDDGLTWQQTAATDIHATQLAFPVDPKELLIGGGLGVALSYDNGDGFSPHGLTGLPTQALLVHPAEPLRVFAGNRGAGIFRSDDGGLRWAAYNVGVPRAHILSLAGHPTDPDIVIAGYSLENDARGSTSSGGLLRSNDGGRHWLTALDEVGRGSEIIPCAANPQIWYAAVRRGLYRSDDAGVSWFPTDAFVGLDVLDLALANDDCDQVVVTAYQSGLWRSDDGGATATGPHTDGLALDPTRLAPLQIAMDPAHTDRLFAATHGGLHQSDDGGLSWSLIDTAKGLNMTSAAVSDDGTLWAATWGNGLWRRPPSAPWQRVPLSAFPRDFLSRVLIEPSAGDLILASTTSGFWRSDDAGLTFALVNDAPRNITGGLFLDTQTVLVTTQVAGLMRSDDGGQTWRSTSETLTPWPTSAGTFVDVRSLVVDPDVPDRLFAGTNGRGMLISLDGANTWQPLPPTPFDPHLVVALAIQPAPQSTLVAAVQGSGVWHSWDAGQTWFADASGLESLQVTDLKIDPTTARLYLSSAQGPIYHSDDAVAWAPLDRWCFDVPGVAKLLMIPATAQAPWRLGALASGNRYLEHEL